MEMSKEDLLEIEHQLSVPHGDNGIKIGEEMNKSNIEMTRSGFKALKIQDNDNILEIGHGNCAHLREVLTTAKDIRYTGVEISETMNFEAIKLNSLFCEKNIANFKLYNGTKLPFDNSTFNNIFTVNSIYFWEDTVGLLNEIYRVLKPKGKLAISFAEKSFMEKLPFVQKRFTLYDDDIIQNLVTKTSFKIVSITGYEDEVKAKHGEIFIRKYAVALLQKE